MIYLNILISLFLMVNEPCVNVKKKIEVKLVDKGFVFNEDADYWVNVEGQRAVKLTESHYNDSTLCKFKVYKAEVIDEFTLQDLKKDTILINYYDIKMNPECVDLKGRDREDTVVLQVDEKRRMIVVKSKSPQVENRRTIYFY